MPSTAISMYIYQTGGARLQGDFKGWLTLILWFQILCPPDGSPLLSFLSLQRSYTPECLHRKNGTYLAALGLFLTLRVEGRAYWPIWPPTLTYQPCKIFTGAPYEGTDSASESWLLTYNLPGHDHYQLKAAAWSMRNIHRRCRRYWPRACL